MLDTPERLRLRYAGHRRKSESAVCRTQRCQLISQPNRLNQGSLGGNDSMKKIRNLMTEVICIPKNEFLIKLHISNQPKNLVFIIV